MHTRIDPFTLYFEIAWAKINCELKTQRPIKKIIFGDNNENLGEKEILFNDETTVIIGGNYHSISIKKADLITEGQDLFVFII